MLVYYFGWAMVIASTILFIGLLICYGYRDYQTYIKYRNNKSK